MRTYLILICCFNFLAGCGQMTTTDKPIPAETKQLQSFPLDIQGDYLNSDDNSILTITNNSVTKTYYFDHKFLKDSIGPNNFVKGDTMYNKYSDDKEKINLSGDTIIQHIKKVIPLFKISKDNVLKKHKGYYFLNNRFADYDWIVTIISVIKGVMTVQGIQDIKIDQLNDLTNENTDTTSFDINTVRKQLNNVLIENGIGRSKYLRLTKNGR